MSTYQRFVIKAGLTYTAPSDHLVEGDAPYFLAAGDIAGGSIKVIGIGRND